jgi:hypothetical protein
MKRKDLAVYFVGGIAACSASALAIAFLDACINEHARPVSDAGPSTGTVDCDSGGPGGFPAPNCDPSDNSCPSTGAGCTIDQATCGDPSTCLPLAENKGKPTYDLRLRRLLITAPPSLAGGNVGFGVLQTTVIDKGIDLNAPSCGDHGNGAFSWIMRVDPTGNTIMTGGAPPSPDPKNTGFCFYRYNIGGIDVQPVTAPITFDDAGAFTTQAITLLNVPIFLSPDAGAAVASNVVVLPLRNAAIKNATVSANGDCIGAFDSKALDTTCSVADPSSCSKWRTAGALGGAITLEDADKVPLTILPETLCVLLTGGSKQDGGQGCARDGSNNIVAKGDYCSTSNKPGDCQDSFWLSATFAAAAVVINDGSSEPTCQGPSDAGTDGGADSGDAAGD